jgi:hypothetical protein
MSHQYPAPDSISLLLLLLFFFFWQYWGLNSGPHVARQALLPLESALSVGQLQSRCQQTLKDSLLYRTLHQLKIVGRKPSSPHFCIYKALPCQLYLQNNNFFKVNKNNNISITSDNYNNILSHLLSVLQCTECRHTNLILTIHLLSSQSRDYGPCSSGRNQVLFRPHAY